jgi:hypothetical protein
MAIESLVGKKYFLTSEQSVIFCEFVSPSVIVIKCITLLICIENPY